ncbi:DUF2332 domain-containing protein [Candidatus Gracilibacteria bacterium]|nr:DUF2332 domain-containing protein [Candidatus Gracilibacteria bacterium]
MSLNPLERNHTTIAAAFHVFVQNTDGGASPLYHHLSARIAEDNALIDLALATRAGQPPPNMLFAAVQMLLLAQDSGRRMQDSEDLAAYYPNLGGERAPDAALFGLFRAFCLRNEERTRELLTTKITQTNEVRRCTLLLPAFATVAARGGKRPLALIEIGPSAGLNLHFDRYGYWYASVEQDAEFKTQDSEAQMAQAQGQDGRQLGLHDSSVQLRTTLRGPHRPPLPATFPAVASRVGVDLNPIDVHDEDAVRWLEALIWPEHTQRFANLKAAIELARRNPPPLIAGDALELLPDLLAALPEDVTPCVFHTFVVYQFPPAARAQLDALLHAAAKRRTIYRIGCEGQRAGRSCGGRATQPMSPASSS